MAQQLPEVPETELENLAQVLQSHIGMFIHVSTNITNAQNEFAGTLTNVGLDFITLHNELTGDLFTVLTVTIQSLRIPVTPGVFPQ